MRIVNLINKILNPIGAQLAKYPHEDIKRRISLINYYKINKILDVGASVGLYGETLRKLNFEGKILSFEPLSHSYSNLIKNSKNDKNWEVYNYALGDKNSEVFINIAKNSDSSSILEMLPRHVKGAPDSKYVGKEKIKLVTLDSIFDKIYKKDDNIYMKIDTQGFEKKVLDGSENSLKYIKAIQIEMSLKPLYKGSILYLDMIEYMKQNNFELISLENGFSDYKTGELLQIDGIFFRID